MTQENELLVEAALQKLNESRESTIKKLVNLNDEQKKILLDYFTGPGQAWWKDIDWNKWKTLQWEDFQVVLNKSAVGGLDYGVDYLKIYDGVFEGEPFVIYQPLTHRGAKVLQSNDIPPVRTDGGMTAAKWCIGWQRSDEYWNRYTSDGDKFYFVFGETIPTKKVAVEMQNDGTNIVWDYTDRTDHPVKFEELPPEAQDLINKFQEGRAARAIEELKADVLAGRVKGVTYTNGRFNFKNIDRYDIRRRFFNRDKDTIKVPVGTWIGAVVFTNWFSNQDFIPLQVDALRFAGDYSTAFEHGTSFDFSNCIVNESLQVVGCDSENLHLLPTVVNGTVRFSSCTLNSFEGWGAKKVKKIIIKGEDRNVLKSLKGCPETRVLLANGVQLKSLEGSPKRVRVFDVGDNLLPNLIGGPKEVTSAFRADHNQLETLEGGPKEGDFDIEYNISGNANLTSLEGCPKFIEGQFNASACPNITSLKGAPEDVGNAIYLRGVSIPREELIEYIKGIRG